MNQEMIKWNKNTIIIILWFKCNLCWIYIIVPLPFRHNLNYFSFIQKIEKLFLICAEILIKSKIFIARV
jgi:hypothetical protein